MKKVLYWILIFAAIGGITKSCESCSSDNKETKSEQAHKNNNDGYYDGQYSFRRGMEWGELKIEGQAWIAQGVQEMPFSGLEQFGYSGVIRGTELIVNQTMYGTNATGEVFAEFDGNKISTGGWTYTR